MKTALITGASSGLGKALALELAKRDYSLILVARDKERLEALELGAEIIAADLSRDRREVIGCIHDKAPDLIINCAGFGLYGQLLSHPFSSWQEMLSVNAEAVLEITYEGAKALQNQKKKGTILNISSAAAFFSYPTFCVYAASKAFVLRFSQAADAELKSDGIRVLTACPGQIDTAFRTRASNDFPQKKDRLTMTVKKAVACIMHQLDTGKSVCIFDWRTRFLIRFARLLPQSLLNHFLKTSLRDRYSS